MSIEISNEVSMWSYDAFATVLSKQALQTRHLNFVEYVKLVGFPPWEFVTKVAERSPSIRSNSEAGRKPLIGVAAELRILQVV
jgi:hypothetical protein